LALPWRCGQGNDYIEHRRYNVVIFEDKHKKGKWSYTLPAGPTENLRTKDLRR
jgi:hypothetical protein